MPALADLKHQMRDLALKSHELITDETVDRAAKIEATQKFDADIKALAEQIKDEEYLAAQRKSLGDILGGGDPTPVEEPKVAAKSLAEQFLDASEVSAALKQITSGGKANTTVELDGFMRQLGVKAVLESGLGSANVVPQDRVPGIVPILFERLTVADLMPNTTTTGNTVRSVIESTATNNAATVAEGAAKPASVLNYTVVDEPVRKIANFIKVSDEMMEDLPYVQGQIQGRLALFVQLQEEAQLLTGAGAGTDLVGILNRAGLTAAQAKGADSVAVAVHKEITKIRVASFLDPDAIVMHPNDWEGAALEQDANGQFFGPGPFAGPYGNTQVDGGTYAGRYWGLRVVVTQSQTQNTALIGAFALGGEVVRRKGVTVTMTNSDQDDFIKNLVTILAEERVALRVIRPSAFGTVTGV